MVVGKWFLSMAFPHARAKPSCAHAGAVMAGLGCLYACGAAAVYQGMSNYGLSVND